MWKEISDLEKTLEAASEEDLAFFWRVRKSRSKEFFPKIKALTMIWNECERRYPGLSRKPIAVRLPYFANLDAGKMKAIILRALDEREWPGYLIAWHKAHVRVITESQPSIEDILCNVTKPWMPHGECRCAEVKERLRKKDPLTTLPEMESHIFFISRDYHGPNARALSVGGNNIPQQTMWDLAKAWEKVGKQLPECMQMPAKEWKKQLDSCLKTATSSRLGSTFTRQSSGIVTLRTTRKGDSIARIFFSKQRTSLTP